MDDFDQLAGSMTEDDQAVEGKSTFDRIRGEFEDRRLARASATGAKREDLNDGVNGHDAPRVEALIDGVMVRYPGVELSRQRSAAYFEAVHQELAPLARGLEWELRQAQRQVDDLAMLAGRLARALRKAEPESELSKAAVEYLHRNGFASPLRQEG